MLGFGIETDCEASLPRTAFMMRWFLSLDAAEPKWGCLSLEPSCRISRGVAHAHEEKIPLNVATVAPNRHWSFGRSRQFV
jgi:hypothetical protein